MLDRRALCAAFPNWLSVDRLGLTIAVSALLFWTAPVQGATVAIVRPASSSPSWTETLSRLHGELLSVGLAVKLADGPAPGGLGAKDSRAWLEDMAAAQGFDAVIDIVGDMTPVAVDVWVIDKASRRFAVSRVAVDPNAANASEQLAIRAIEVLRSSFLEIDWAARGRRDDANARMPATLPPAELSQTASPAERFGLEVGATALASLDGIGPSLLPLVRLGWAARSWLVLQAALAGLGSRPTVVRGADKARVAQQYGVLGGGFHWRSGQRLRPFAGLFAGVLRTSVDGQAESPRQGHVAEQWSFLLDGSLGVGLRLHGRYYLTLAADVQVAAPYVAIYFVDAVVATSGRPNLLLTLTVGAWL